jgi:hypothetical protein
LAAVILAKRAIIGLLNSATLVEFSNGDQWTDIPKRSLSLNFIELGFFLIRSVPGGQVGLKGLQKQSRTKRNAKLAYF